MPSDLFPLNTAATLAIFVTAFLWITAPSRTNDTDLDFDTLSAVYDVGNGPNQGILTLNADGSFSYTPTAGFTGMDTFNYHANDGTLDSNFATVTITINDTQAPVVNCAETTALLWPPSGDLVNIGLSIGPKQ